MKKSFASEAVLFLLLCERCALLLSYFDFHALSAQSVGPFAQYLYFFYYILIILHRVHPLSFWFYIPPTSWQSSKTPEELEEEILERKARKKALLAPETQPSSRSPLM